MFTTIYIQVKYLELVIKNVNAKKKVPCREKPSKYLKYLKYLNSHYDYRELKPLNARRIIQRQRYDSSSRSFLSLHFPWLSFIPLLHNLATYAASSSTDADAVDNDNRQVFGTFSRSLREFDPRIPKRRAHLFDTLPAWRPRSHARARARFPPRRKLARE